MRYFFRRRIPEFRRVVVVESGSRQLLEDLLPGIYELYAEKIESLDLVTCYSGAPVAFRADRGKVYRVTDYPGGEARSRLYRELGRNKYSIIGIVCSGEPIMTKWKWVLAARVRAKLFILNENGDYFWADWGHWKNIRHFVAYRSGLAGAGAVPAIARLVLFPFTLLYLLLFAAAVHLRRKVRA